jgi:hypothetical protein
MSVAGSPVDLLEKPRRDDLGSAFAPEQPSDTRSTVAFMLGHYDVGDYDSWKRERFDADPAGRKQLLRLPRSSAPIALGTEEDLRRVDLYEPDPLPVAKRDRVPIDHMVYAVHR